MARRLDPPHERQSPSPAYRSRSANRPASRSATSASANVRRGTRRTYQMVPMALQSRMPHPQQRQTDAARRPGVAATSRRSHLRAMGGRTEYPRRMGSITRAKSWLVLPESLRADPSCLSLRELATPQDSPNTNRRRWNLRMFSKANPKTKPCDIRLSKI